MQEIEHNKSEIINSHKVRKEQNGDRKNRMPTEKHEGDNACGEIRKIANILQKPLEQRNGPENGLINRFIEQNFYLKGITSKISKEFTKNLMKKAKIHKISRNKVLARQGQEISEVGIIIEGKVNVYKKQSQDVHAQINKDEIWHELLNKSAKQIKQYKTKSKIIRNQPSKIYEDAQQISHLIQSSTLEFKICQNQDYGMEDLAIGSQFLRTFITDQECTILIIKEEDLIIYLQQALKDKIKALTAQIKSIKCFSFLESDKINPIIQHLSLHKIKRGEKIYTQGDQVSGFYLLIDGEVRLNKNTNLFEQNPNELYFSRTKLVEETLFKNQKKSDMNKQESQIFERKIKRSILPYANLKNMYNYQPVQKNIEIAVMTNFCFFGEEEFLENKKREASAICSSLDCDYYEMKIKKIQEILGNKLWPTFKKKLKDSVSRKVLYRQTQYASNLQFQNKAHMNYFYIDQGQDTESPSKFKIQKFNSLLQPAKRLATPEKLFTREGQRKSLDEFPIATPPRYTAFNFNKLMKKPEEVNKTDDDQGQFQYKDEKQLRIMNVSHTWRLMKQKVDFQLRASKKISPVKQVINIKEPLIQAQFFYHMDRQKKRIDRQHRKRVLSLGRSLQIRKGSNFSARK